MKIIVIGATPAIGKAVADALVTRHDEPDAPLIRVRAEGAAGMNERAPWAWTSSPRAFLTGFMRP